MKRKGDVFGEAGAKTVVVVRGESASSRRSSPESDSKENGSPTPHDILSSTASPTLSLTPRANLLLNFESGGGETAAGNVSTKDAVSSSKKKNTPRSGGAKGSDKQKAKENDANVVAADAEEPPPPPPPPSEDRDEGRGSPDCVVGGATLAVRTWEESLQVLQHFVDKSQPDKKEDGHPPPPPVQEWITALEARPAALRAKARVWKEQLQAKIALAKQARQEEWNQVRQEEAVCLQLETECRRLQSEWEQSQGALAESRQRTQRYQAEAAQELEHVQHDEERLKAQIRKHLTTIELYAQCTGVKFDNDDHHDDGKDRTASGGGDDGPRGGEGVATTSRRLSHLRGEIQCPSKATLRRFSLEIANQNSYQVAQALWNLIRGQDNEEDDDDEKEQDCKNPPRQEESVPLANS